MDMINVWSHSASIEAFQRKPSNPGPGFSNVWQNLRLMQRIAGRNGPEVLALRLCRLQCLRRRTRSRAVDGMPGALRARRSRPDDSGAIGAVADRACADATVVVLEGGGHSLMAERPDEVLAALKDFAARVFASTAAT